MAQAVEEKKAEEPEVTLGLIKPDSFPRADEIIARILTEGFRVVEKKQVLLTKTRAEAFYAEHKVTLYLQSSKSHFPEISVLSLNVNPYSILIGFQGKGFFDELVGFMTSGPIYALKLEKVDSIKSWRTLMGPTKFEVAQKEAPNSLRATFATNTTKNAVHGSDSPDSAARELDFFFNVQLTLALIKPDAVAAGKADEIVQRIESEGFTIVERETVSLTKERAEAFYAEHKVSNFFVFYKVSIF